MSEIHTIRRLWFIAAVAAAMLLPVLVAAQDDPGETPLGDVARSLRKKEPTQAVIDNDNLKTVMDQVQSHRLAGVSLLYSIDGGGKTFQVSAPDATCSLSFTANAKALLNSQYSQMQLPPNELAKLEGPAMLDGESLQVTLFNGTDWHVSEIAIALTLVKSGTHEESEVHETNPETASPKPDAAADPDPQLAPAQKSAAKSSDSTVLYRVRGAAPPAETTIFSTPLNMEIPQGQEWHWAIVEAKGYPPQHTSQTSTISSAQASTQ